MKKNLSIVIPAKNEEKRISKTLHSYSKFFANKNSELIIVVNNSNDKTSSIVRNFQSHYPFIKLIETDYATGKGGAVALGFNTAEGKFIGYTDADGASSPAEFYRLYTVLKETPSLSGVIGSRYLSTSKVLNTISLHRGLLSAVYRLSTRILFGLDYKDTKCGVKIFKRSVAKEVAKRLSTTGWTFDLNILLVCKHLNYKIQEVATIWSEKAGSKFSVLEALINVPKELLSLKKLELETSFKILVSRVKNHKAVPSSKKRNILIFAWRDVKHPEAGGSEVYVHNIAKRLAKKDTVYLFTSKPGDLSDRDEIDGVKIIRKGNFLTVYLYAFIYYVLFFRKDMDYIIDVENGIPFFTPLYSRKPKMMLLHHVHKDQWFTQFKLPIALVGYILEMYVMPVLYRKISVITVSPSSIESLKQLGFSDRNIYLAYNATPSEYKVKNAKKSSEPTLLYVGRIKKYKRLEIALSVLKDLSKKYKTLRLFIGGAGDYEDKLKLLAHQMGLTKKVEFLGFVSEKQKNILMSKAWAFLMPSQKEGWGITTVEANLNGTPSIGFNVPGVRDSIKHGYSGYLANDYKEYVMLVDKILSSQDLRESLGRTAKEWASKFSWETAADVFRVVIGIKENPGLVDVRQYPWTVASANYQL